MKRWYVLSNLIKRKNYKTIVELGVWQGKTAKPLLNLHPEIDYTGVDLYKMRPEAEESHALSENSHVWDHEKYLEEIQEACAAHPSAKLLRVDTVEAAAQFEDGSVDLVFIDADHSYESVKSDIEAWLPKVRAGGIVSGHDYHEDFGGVIKAVSEYFPSIEIYDDNVWVKYV